VLTAVVALDRPELKERVVDSPEVLAVVGAVPHLAPFLQSLYECKYADFYRVSGFHWDIGDERGLFPCDLCIWELGRSGSGALAEEPGGARDWGAWQEKSGTVGLEGWLQREGRCRRLWEVQAGFGNKGVRDGASQVGPKGAMREG
jgi:hypothetical protein